MEHYQEFGVGKKVTLQKSQSLLCEKLWEQKKYLSKSQLIITTRNAPLPLKSLQNGLKTRRIAVQLEVRRFGCYRPPQALVVVVM